MNKQRRVAIAMQKGGVGKTTLVCQLATMMDYRLELNFPNSLQKILVVDMDPQASCTNFFLELAPDPSLTVASLFSEDSWGVVSYAPQLIHKTDYDRVDIVPSSIFLSAAEIRSIEEATRRLSYFLDATATEYDIVLIDCPPNLGRLTSNVLMAATDVLIPVQPEAASIEALNLLVQTISKVKNINTKLNLLGIVVTLIDRRISPHQQYLTMLQERFDHHILAELNRASNVLKKMNARLSMSTLQKADKNYTDFRRFTDKLLLMLSEPLD